MKKARESFLLSCPICDSKMWFHGANDHRKSKHSDVALNEFEALIVAAIEGGEIQPKKFESIDSRFVSATHRMAKERKHSKLGIRTVVSGGKTK